MGYKNVVKFSALKIFSSSFEMNYERMFDNRSSFMLSLSANAGQNWQETRTGVGAELQYRWYFNPWDYRPKKADSNLDFYGLYVAPYGQYAYTDLKEETEVWDWQTEVSRTIEAHGTHGTVGGGLILGVQFAVHSKFAFDFFLGGGGRYDMLLSGTDSGLDRSPLSPVYTGVTPRIGMRVGLAF